MKQFLVELVAGLALIVTGGLGYIVLSMAPVATDSSPLPFERLLAGIALHARIRKEAPQSSPIQPSDTAYIAGAQIYREDCAVCHGLPGQNETAIGKGEPYKSNSESLPGRAGGFPIGHSISGLV